MSKRHILLEDKINETVRLHPEFPSNAHKVIKESPSEFPISLPSPIDLTGLGDRLNEKIAELARIEHENAKRKFTYQPAKLTADVTLDMLAAALQRSNGKVDLMLRAGVTYHPAYVSDDALALRSFFQDEVSFRIWPDDPSIVHISSTGTFPETDKGEVSYSKTMTWTVGGGFEVGTSGASASVKIDYSKEIAASTVTKDFDIEKHTFARGELKWISRMRNMYSGNNADATGYQMDNPACIVEGRLKNPPATARADLDLTYCAAYTGVPQDIASRQIRFHYETRQRLIYARVVGQTGPKSAPVGGKAFWVPYYVICSGSFTLDLASRVLRHEGFKPAGYRYTDRLPD